MTWTLREAEHKYVFDVAGVADLPEVHNPDGHRFRPDTVVVLRYGNHCTASISGPRVKSDGTLYTRTRGLTGWDLGDVTAPEQPDNPDPIPVWLREIFAEVTR